MKKIFSILLLTALALFPCSAADAELELAKDGKTSYTIVTADAPTQLERLAAEDLQYFLKQVTGADFKIVKKSQAPAARRIFVGMTGQAEKLAGQHKLTEQNPVIQCVGKDIYLFGKGKRGSLYAAYEFIENRLGCRFLDAHGFIYAPKRTKLTVPTGTYIARYAFPVRSRASVSERLGVRRESGAGIRFPPGSAAPEKASPVFRKQAERAVRVADDAAVIDQIHGGHDRREHQKQRQHRRYDKAPSQPADHEAASSE